MVEPNRMAAGFDMGPPRLDQAGSTAADLLVHPGMGLSLADRLGRYQGRAYGVQPFFSRFASSGSAT